MENHISLTTEDTNFISNSEKEFIRNGCEINIRNDGRNQLDYREFIIEKLIIPHTSGSSRINIDNTEILVGINLEIGEPNILTPNSGRIEVNVQCTPSISPMLSKSQRKSLNISLSKTLQAFLMESNVIDLKKLCIIPEQQCWIVHIDALILDSAGNLLDATSIAIKAALMVTTIPQVNVITNEDGDMELEVSDDPFDAKPFPHELIPICISLNRIGTCFVVDTTIEEELCLSSRISIAVNESKVCGIEMFGPGGIASSSIPDLIRQAKIISRKIFEKITKQIL